MPGAAMVGHISMCALSGNHDKEPSCIRKMVRFTKLSSPLAIELYGFEAQFKHDWGFDCPKEYHD